MMRPSLFRLSLVALVVLAASGCKDQDPRILPFAQPKLELLVGESIDVSVALSAPANEEMQVDVSSQLDGVRYEPATLVYATGSRVASVKLTGAKSTRGAFQPVRFDLRGTDTGNSLLILVSNRIDPVDGGGDAADGGGGDDLTPDQGSPEGIAPDSGVDAPAIDAGSDGAAADGASNG
ncbi:MAG: hypothetical protein KC503_18070 [Myxococcales bacterium]|nr:hypothetical protein [Myxococcales bacterium]